MKEFYHVGNPSLKRELPFTEINLKQIRLVDELRLLKDMPEERSKLVEKNNRDIEYLISCGVISASFEILSPNLIIKPTSNNRSALREIAIAFDELSMIPSLKERALVFRMERLYLNEKLLPDLFSKLRTEERNWREKIQNCNEVADTLYQTAFSLSPADITTHERPNILTTSERLEREHERILNVSKDRRVSMVGITTFLKDNEKLLFEITQDFLTTFLKSCELCEDELIPYDFTFILLDEKLKGSSATFSC